MMANDIKWPYWSVAFALAVAGRIIHYFAITSYFRRRGIHMAYRWYSIYDWADMGAYRRARLSEGQPLTWWYVLCAIHILIGVMFIGWCYLAWSE